MNESYSHLDKIESIFNLGAFVILICYPYLLSLFVILICYPYLLSLFVILICYPYLLSLEIRHLIRVRIISSWCLYESLWDSSESDPIDLLSLSVLCNECTAQ